MPLIPGATAPTTAAGASGAAGSASKPTGASGAFDDLGGDAFLKLLVAQMKNQNPMEPTDSSQYLAQISQYAMVEQMQKVNQGQEQATAYQRALAASSLIGRHVAGVGETGTIVNGVVIGVDYQAGKPVLVTTGCSLPLDAVDGARATSDSAPPTATTTTTVTSASNQGDTPR